MGWNELLIELKVNAMALKPNVINEVKKTFNTDASNEDQLLFNVAKIMADQYDQNGHDMLNIVYLYGNSIWWKIIWPQYDGDIPGLEFDVKSFE